MTAKRIIATALLGLATLTTLPVLQGCAPLLVGGAVVGGVLVAADRRTTGAQIEDQAIELKASNRITDLATLSHVNVTSYNRMVLLTGEAPSEADRARIEQTVAGVDNVRSVVNELAVAGNSSMTARSNDTLLTSRVKSSFLEDKAIRANAVKVVTERGTVYLMGRLTEREAKRSADRASTVPGVQKVVRVFELISEDELAQLQPAAKR